MRPAPLQRRTELARSGRIRWRSPRRIARERVFAPYVAWLTAPGGVCVVCGETRNLQGSHVDDQGDMVRMCGRLGRRAGCHEEWGERKGRFEGWSRDQREQASIPWRVLHWEAFLDHVGVRLEELGGRHTYQPEQAGEVVALVECEAAIRTALARLAPERSAA